VLPCFRHFLSSLEPPILFESFFPLQKSKSIHGGEFLQFFGIFSAVLIAVGLIPQYIEIWRLGEVIGISLVFMAIDIMGGVFSLLSLAFRRKFDVVASTTYIAVIVMDGVVVVCALILNPRARRRREAALSDSASTSPSASASDNSPSSAVSGTKEVGDASPISEKSGVLECGELPDIIDLERGTRIKTSRN